MVGLASALRCGHTSAMGTLGSVLLLALSALACEKQLAKHRSTRVQSVRFWLQAIAPLSGFLGLGALASGAYAVLSMLMYIGFIRVAPVVWTGTLVAGLCSMGLGLRFGHSMAHAWLQKKRLVPGSILRSVERLHARLVESEQLMGQLGLLAGFFVLLINLVK